MAILRRWHDTTEQDLEDAQEIPNPTSSDTKYRQPSITSLASFMPNKRNEMTRCRRHVWGLGLSLFCFPVIYTVLALPLAIARLGDIAQTHWSDAVLWVGASLYACGGMCNVVCYTATREGIIPWNWFRWRKWFPQVISEYLYPHHLENDED